MKDEEDMLELLDDEGTADQLDLELDEPDEDSFPESENIKNSAAPEADDSEESGGART